MSFASFALRHLYGLPPRLSRATRHAGITVTAADGTRLLTEHHAPRLAGRHPTLLMRVPYGLAGFATVAEAYAERGYNVVLQACRGTGGSGGEFDPLTHEREDGLATLAWIKAQPFFDGRLGTTGPSYLGYAQWAISDALPAHSAMATKVTSAEFRSIVFPGGAFHLGLWLGWLQVIEGLRRPSMDFAGSMWSGRIERKTLRASMQLPLRDADRRVAGRAVPFWRHWLANAFGNDGFWEPLDHTHRIGPRTPPNHFISGWYDFMVDQLLRDYRLLVEAGGKPYLTVGPWFHVANELQKQSVLQTLVWMDAHLLGRREALREKPVRLFIMGLDRWRDFDAYPPGAPEEQLWHLHPEGKLARRPAPASAPDGYRYDPADPTPNLGGAIFAFRGAGPVDNRRLERRKDVLTYTSEPLGEPLTVIGNVRATIYARSTNPNTDFFVRLCDVSPAGRSVNVCDGIIRKTSRDPAVPEDVWKLAIRLHPTAHQFRAGHRLRLLVASGAHPRFARNSGTDEPVGDATRLVPAAVEIFHDPRHPGTLQLPVHQLDP